MSFVLIVLVLKRCASELERFIKIFKLLKKNRNDRLGTTLFVVVHLDWAKDETSMLFTKPPCFGNYF